MAHSLMIHGEEGQVRWGYLSAVTLRSWTMAKDETGQLTLTAGVASVDTFRASQRPLMFVVPRANGAWRWPILTELQIVDGTLSASLGPKEPVYVFPHASA